MVLRESNKKFNVPAVRIGCGVASAVFDMRPVITPARRPRDTFFNPFQRGLLALPPY